MCDTHSSCKGHDHGDHDHHDHGQGHAHGHHGGLHFLHKLIVERELPLLDTGITWTDGGLWLDYGCGDGHMAKEVFLPHAQKNNAKIIGMDRKEHAINRAKGQALPEHSITFVKGNILGDWPLGEQVKFDKIFVIHVLQYFKNYEDFLTKALDILKPGGEIGLTVPVSKLATLFAEIEKNPKCGKLQMEDTEEFQGKWSTNSDFIPGLKEFILKQGFELKTFEFLPYSYEFKNLHTFAEIVAEHWIEKKSNGAELKEELTNEVKGSIKSMYEEISPTAEPFPMEISSLIVILKKPE